MKKIIIFFISHFFLLPTILIGQIKSDTVIYPTNPSLYIKDYYLFPIKPFKKNYLTGNMGELRGNHFHAGLDIKTDFGSLPVYAAADGYVSRISIQSRGYGTTLFLTHPNGQTTLYAHLHQYEPKLAQYIREQQYLATKFETDIQLSKEQFVYKKGDVIAYSGNSGSSGGPHLHWEIRDEKGNFVNPLLYKFGEITDKTCPHVNKIAIKPMSANCRINGEFNRLELSPKKVRTGEYEIIKPIYVRGTIGVEAVAYDMMNGISSLNGVNYIDLYIDNFEYFNYSLEKFAHKHSKCLNVHIDYETANRKRSLFQKCYVADGNQLGAYKSYNQGKITINDTLMHSVRIRFGDSNGNITTLKFLLKGGIPHKIEKDKVLFKIKKAKPIVQYSLWENFLKISYPAHQNESSIAQVFADGKLIELPSAYNKSSSAVYIWDMRLGKIDSIVFCDNKQVFNFTNVIPKGKEVLIENDFSKIKFFKESLFDTLYLSTKKLKETYKIGDFSTPLANEIGITIPTKGIDESLKPFVKAYIEIGRGLRLLAGEWKGDNYEFKTAYLGNFCLKSDKVPPTIKVFRKNRQIISAVIRDNLSGISKIDCFVNNQWVLMNYDAKTATIWSEKSNKDIPFKGLLKIQVTDNVGNMATYNSYIK